MPILQQDIKLLKSAVMADTTDGGGPLTGNVVVDGQSNNIYPDTSAVDRAFGRIQLRKVFGVAHTTDTDTLLGSHMTITDAPDDPLVHCVLMKAGSWGETHDAAKDRVEKYVVKGPRLSVSLYDTHYAGGMQIQLLTFVDAPFPAGGDAIVLTNPNGTSQYVRILKVSVSSQNIAITENGNVIVLPGKIAKCDLGQELAYDFPGPPASRVINDALYTQVNSTSTSTGAKFYGIKPLQTAGAVGDVSALVSGGIYSPLVPAATVETPIVDQLPLLGRASVVSTGNATVTLDAVVITVGPGTVLHAPTAIKPSSVALAVSATSFADDGKGGLLQGALVVGTVDYSTGLITFSATSPAYGTASTALSYIAATITGASSNSAALEITQANQGLAFTTVFSPSPAPGSLTLGYMAQARWYDLQDNLVGKLAGADSSYGVGSINYTTGSMAVTLGAIPDVGSVLIANWGDQSSAVATDPATRPGKIGTLLPVPDRTRRGGITVTWSRGGVNYTASTNGDGVLTGDATGKLVESSAYLVGGSTSFVRLQFEPNLLPDGVVNMATSVGNTNFGCANLGGGHYQLTDVLPVVQGSFAAVVSLSYSSDTFLSGLPTFADVFDAAGVLYIKLPAATGLQNYAIGTLDYTTGVMVINPTVSTSMWSLKSLLLGSTYWNAGAMQYQAGVTNTIVTLGNSVLQAVKYANSANAVAASPVTLGPWQMQVGSVQHPLIASGVLFRVSGDLYSAAAGALRKTWSVATGTFTSAGSVTSDGLITITSLPANGVNAVTWYNAAQDTAPRRVTEGVFRTATAPLKSGVFQLHAGSDVGSGSDAGVISGGFTGSADYTRGLVRWTKGGATNYIDPADLSYNAVFLQYLPLDKTLLGLDTARLPLDGKVPIYRAGDLVVVHNTLSTSLPNPVVLGTNYSLGRTRVAAVKVVDAAGAVVPSTSYVTDLDAGTARITASVASYTQPLAVQHRIEDIMLCLSADISGLLKFTRGLTHVFPAGSSFVSGALVSGDLFARAYNLFDQQTWTNEWSDTLIGNASLAQYNTAQNPVLVTNAGAITEDWLLLFKTNTEFRVIGRSVGEIGIGSINADTAPVNPATLVPYWTIQSGGWGTGWAAGNLVRFKTDACGVPFWLVRTVLQGPATLNSDKFTVAFRGDVNA